MVRKEIKPSIIKELYAKCGNMCAFSGCDNRLFSDEEEGKTHISNICHIEGYNKGSARYNPNLCEDEANDISNLILLCRNHHGYIDQNENIYTVEVIKTLKKLHEQRIKELLYKKVLNSSIIDSNNIKFNLIIQHINSSSDYNVDEQYLSTLLKKISRQKPITREILFKIIEYYYENETLNMTCIWNETTLSDLEFSLQLKLLIENDFIDETYYDNSIRSFIEVADDEVEIVSENYLYKMYNGTWQLKKRGYILIEFLNYINNLQCFYDLLVNLNLMYIKE